MEKTIRHWAIQNGINAAPGVANRQDMACIYADAILNCGPDDDWRSLNQAILLRWTTAGLRYIKSRAWLLARGGDSHV
jgi:hypothetical protein